MTPNQLPVSPIEKALSKLRSAQICHPNAVQHLIEETIEALAQQAPSADRPIDPEVEIKAAWSVIGAEQGSPRSVAFRDGAHWQRGQDMKSLSDTSAQQAQEPVAWVCKSGHGTVFRESITPELASLEHGGRKVWTPLYTTPPAPQVPAPVVSEDDLVACLISSGCVGTVKMSFESGPMSITRPSLNATKFARAILALRPQAVPMTDDQIVQGQEQQGAQSILSFMKGVRFVEAHHGVTAKAEGGA